jgi:hypothetical protein
MLYTQAMHTKVPGQHARLVNAVLWRSAVATQYATLLTRRYRCKRWRGLQESYGPSSKDSINLFVVQSTGNLRYSLCEPGHFESLGSCYIHERLPWKLFHG